MLFVIVPRKHKIIELTKNKNMFYVYFQLGKIQVQIYELNTSHTK